MSGAAAAGVAYVGFWARLVATLLDTLWTLAAIIAVLALLGGDSLAAQLRYWREFGRAVAAIAAGTAAELPAAPPAGLVENLAWYLLPALLVLALWRRWLATPGKMLVRARIVDAVSGRPPTTTRLVIRYLGYYLSGVPLLLGFLWVAFDPRKQGWHDKLAGTVVVYLPAGGGAGR